MLKADARPAVREPGAVRRGAGVPLPPGVWLAQRRGGGRHAQGLHTGRALHTRYVEFC